MKHTIFLLLLMSITFFQSCDPCNGVNCQNGGTCVNGNCQCPPGYEGVHCELLSPCNSTNSQFKQLYAGLATTPQSYQEEFQADEASYTFSVNTTKKICKLGFEALTDIPGQGNLATLTVGIKDFNAPNNEFLYYGQITFTKNTLEYHAIPPVQLQPGVTYSIFINGGMGGPTAASCPVKTIRDIQLPFTMNYLTVYTTYLQPFAMPALENTALPFLDIVFE